MPTTQELSKFTLAELQRFARAAKPPISQASIYNKSELVQIMASQRHKAKFHDLRGERFAFKRKATTAQKTVAKLAASKARGKMETRVRVAFTRKPKAKPVRVPFKKKANVKAGNTPRDNKGGCKVGRKGESPLGGCKTGKKNPTTKDKTVAQLAAMKGKARGNKRVPYKKK
tara:strand:+ start:825 stop:1340 length:516 start_codon:yes stop_codon:yes gene_type:complete